MNTYRVELTHSISANVDVEADTPEQAVEIVNRLNFPLPPDNEWYGHKDWSYLVMDGDGNELFAVEP